jgi:hypothetical protein
VSAPLRTVLRADFSSLSDATGNTPVIGVMADGNFLACARRSTESPTFSRGIGTFPKSRFDRPTDYHVVQRKGGETREVVIRDEAMAVHFIQAHPEGVMLGSARCTWRPEGPEQNAAVYDWQGQLVRRMTLGDGIQDVRVGPDGTIWVSYFDEGVFGNYGWGNPGPPPMGNHGLLAFDRSGSPTFAYSAEDAGTDTICDAYAMNVAEDGEVWVNFYTEFPIVRIAGGRYQAWTLGIGGARAMAVRGNGALLYGDYKRRALVRRVVLSDDGTASVKEERELQGPDGRALDAPGCGVGGRLYAFDQGRVYAVDDW